MSPTKAESLTSQSTPEETQGGISDCISQMANEHPDWKNEQCIAACYSMAEKAVGHSIGRKSTRVTGTSPAPPAPMI